MATDLNALGEELRAAFPYGHPEFLPMLLEKMKLHSDKNHDYAKGGRPLGNFERVASLLGLYPGLRLDDPVVVMLIYALKQVDATLWGFAQGITQKVEGPIDRLGDVLVYAGIAICALKDRAKAQAPITATEIRERMAQAQREVIQFNSGTTFPMLKPEAVVELAKQAEEQGQASWEKRGDRRELPPELDAPATEPGCSFCESLIEQGKMTKEEKAEVHPPTVEEKPAHRFPVHPWLYRSR